MSSHALTLRRFVQQLFSSITESVTFTDHMRVQTRLGSWGIRISIFTIRLILVITSSSSRKLPCSPFSSLVQSMFQWPWIHSDPVSVLILKFMNKIIGKSHLKVCWTVSHTAARCSHIGMVRVSNAVPTVLQLLVHLSTSSVNRFRLSLPCFQGSV